MVGCNLEDVGFFLSAYLYRRSIQNDIIRFIDDLKAADKSVLDEYIAKREKMLKKPERKKKNTDVTLPNVTNPKGKKQFNGRDRLTAWKKDVSEESVAILREMKISNSRSLDHPKHETMLNKLRKTKFEEPQLVSEFSVLDHTQRCLDEIAEERIQKVTPSKVRSAAKAKPKTRRWTRRILSSVSTRSQKRECSGRIPGFYKPKKN